MYLYSFLAAWFKAAGIGREHSGREFEIYWSSYEMHEAFTKRLADKFRQIAELHNFEEDLQSLEVDEHGARFVMGNGLYGVIKPELNVAIRECKKG